MSLRMAIGRRLVSAVILKKLSKSEAVGFTQNILWHLRILTGKKRPQIKLQRLHIM